MAEWSISKVFSFVVFLAMMILFFLWITTQVSDLGLFFGFRTSHTVSNDIANLMTSISGVPGDVTTTYSISPGSSAQRPFEYEVEISSKLVCVTSFLGGDEARATRDCGTHPYDFDKAGLYKTESGSLSLNIKKNVDPTTKTVCLDIGSGSLDEIFSKGCDKSA